MFAFLRPPFPTASPRLRSPLVAALLVGGLTLSGCSRFGLPGDEGGSQEDEDEEEQATPVVVGTVQGGPISASIVASSTIEAERQVTVHAESTGRIVRLLVEEGDEIKQGQLIARIKYDAQAAGLDRASTSLDKAKRDLETLEKLHAKAVVSNEELDAARLTYEQALLDVRDRRREVGNTRVQAPFGGTVTERFVDEGGFVTSGAQLVSITDFDTLVARVYVPEKELDRIAENQPAQVVGKAARGRRGTGTVQRIAPIVDPTTGTVKVTVGLPSDLVGHDNGGFLPGMYAEVTLTTEDRERATLVPKGALVREDEQAFVFTVDGDRVARTKVELGLENDQHAEVLSGLKIGDEVVVSGQAGLKDGALIKRVDPAGEDVEPTESDGIGLANRGERAPSEGA